MGGAGPARSGKYPVQYFNWSVIPILGTTSGRSRPNEQGEEATIEARLHAVIIASVFAHRHIVAPPSLMEGLPKVLVERRSAGVGCNDRYRAGCNQFDAGTVPVRCR